MSKEILIVKDLNIFCPSNLEKGNKKLLSKINISIKGNEVIGLVGESGSGKSILLNAIGGNIGLPLWVEAEKIMINIDGRMENLLTKNEEGLSKIWGKGIAFIPPNARDRLNPILTVGKQFSNIIQANSQLSLKKAHDKVVELFKMVQMPDPEKNYDSYPHELSGGMAQRVVISIALFMSPVLLLADEPTMGLDVTIQKQVLDLMAKIILNLQSSVILATRDLGIVANYCNKVVVMCNGNIVEFAPVQLFFKNAVHPYSHYLLEAAFASHGITSKVDSSSVSTKEEMEASSGQLCPFVNRCNYAEEMKELCWSIFPPEKYINPDHFLRCHRAGKEV